MTLLSMFAAAGFYALTVTTTRHEAAIASDVYQTAAQRAEHAQTEVDNLAGYAHVLGYLLSDQGKNPCLS